MSDDRKRHTTLTAAPLPGEKPATIRDVLTAVNEHREECSGEQAEKRQAQWSEITAIKLALEGISGRLKMAMWIIGLGVTLGGTVGVFVAKYAIVGAITIELDKRMPPIGHKAEMAADSSHYATVQP